MFLFISAPEIVIVFLVFLMLFGAKSVPGLARTMGRTLRQIRDASDEIKRDISEGTQNLTREFKDQKKHFEDMGPDKSE